MLNRESSWVATAGVVAAFKLKLDVRFNRDPFVCPSFFDNVEDAPDPDILVLRCI